MCLPSAGTPLAMAATKILDNDALEFFTEASYSRTERQNQFAPAPLVTVGGASTAPGDYTIPANKSYVLAQLQLALNRPVELGPRTRAEHRRRCSVYRGSAGTFDTSVSWEAAGFYSEDEPFPPILLAGIV